MYSKDTGGISWIDLTVENADQVQGFYQSVIGLKSKAFSMGDYNDYVLTSPIDSDKSFGVCHAKGPNSDLPAQWLLYFNVEDLGKSIKQCLELGGTVLKDKSEADDYYMCVIKDPAGATVALIENKDS